MTSPLLWTMIATHVPAEGRLGGVVRYTVEMMRALAVRPDVCLRILTTRATADTLEAMIGPEARITVVPNAPAPMLSALERRGPLSLLRNSDVVHGAKHLVPNHTNALRVLTVHDLLLLDRPGDFGRAKRLLLPGPYRASLQNAELLVCVSDATRDRLLAHLPDAAGRATTVRLATSPQLRGAVPASLDAVAGRPFALVVGDPTPRKNLRTLMAAWPEVRARVPGAVLAVAGPPTWGQTDVGEQYESLVADGAVVPLGYVDDAQLRWAYEQAAVVLCPSVAEGFGLPAAEALDLGAQLIISDDPALREVSRSRARAVVAATDVPAWVDAIVSALQPAPARVARPLLEPRTWDEVADETVVAARAALRLRRYGESVSLVRRGGSAVVPRIA